MNYLQVCGFRDAKSLPWGKVHKLFPLAYSSASPWCVINWCGIFWTTFPSNDRILSDEQLHSCHGNHSSLLFMTLRSLKLVRFPSSTNNQRISVICYCNSSLFLDNEAIKHILKVKRPAWSGPNLIIKKYKQQCSSD